MPRPDPDANNYPVAIQPSAYTVSNDDPVNIAATDRASNDRAIAGAHVTAAELASHGRAVAGANVAAADPASDDRAIDSAPNGCPHVFADHSMRPWH